MSKKNIKKIISLSLIVLFTAGFLACKKINFKSQIKVNKKNPVLIGELKARTNSSNHSIKELSDIEIFNIQNGIGKITITQMERRDILVNVSYKVYGENVDDLNKIINEVEIIPKVKNKILKINPMHKGTNECIQHYVENKFKKCSITVNIELIVPKNYYTYNISGDVCAINLYNIMGSINAKTNVGSINVNNVEFNGNCKLDTNLGDIFCHVRKDISHDSDVELSSEVGNMRVKIDKKPLIYDEMKKNSKIFYIDDKCIVRAYVKEGEIILIDKD